MSFGHFSSSTARTSPCRHAHHFTLCCKVFMSPPESVSIGIFKDRTPKREAPRTSGHLLPVSAIIGPLFCMDSSITATRAPAQMPKFHDLQNKLVHHRLRWSRKPCSSARKWSAHMRPLILHSRSRFPRNQMLHPLHLHYSSTFRNTCFANLFHRICGSTLPCNMNSEY